MRSYIFTEGERRKLMEWLATGEEDDSLRVLFVRMRRRTPRLMADMKMLLRMRGDLKRLGRWRRRPRRSESLSRLAESASTPRREEPST